MVKYCPRCGYPNPDEANFCGRCGYQFPPMNQPPTMPQEQPYQPPYPQQPYSSQPTYPQQPFPYQPPYPQQPSKKKFSTKAIIGVALAVAVVLVVFLVVLPMLQPKYTLADAASVAHSYYGGNWNTDSSMSYSASYVGHGEYKVTFANGTTTTMNIYQLNNCFSTELSILTGVAPIQYTGGFFYPEYSNSLIPYPPTKVVLEVINETGTNVSIILFGLYWNYTPNYASLAYNITTAFLTNSTYQEQISSMSQLFSKYGIYFNMYNSGGYDYLVMTINNVTFMQQNIDAYTGLNWTAMGGMAGLSQNDIAVVITINLAPTQSQLHTFLSMVINSL